MLGSGERIANNARELGSALGNGIGAPMRRFAGVMYIAVSRCDSEHTGGIASVDITLVVADINNPGGFAA